MNLDAGDWIAIAAAVIALSSAIVTGIGLRFAQQSANAAARSAKSSEDSAKAAIKSADASERSNELTEGEAASRRAEWKITPGGVGPVNHEFWLCSATLINVGDEAAFNVRIEGPQVVGTPDGVDVHRRKDVSVLFETVRLTDGSFPPLALTVTWDRPKQFGEKDLSDELTVQPQKLEVNVPSGKIVRNYGPSRGAARRGRPPA